jgi:hypothetical protein
MSVNETKNEVQPDKAAKGKSILNRLMKMEHPTKKEEVAKEKEIDKELKSIYRDAQGNMPNLTKLDFIPKNRKRNMIIGLILVLLVIFLVTIFGFWSFRPSPKFSGNNIKLEIKAPFTINSGEKINYQIRFANNEGVSLTKTVLTVNLPDGFIFINSNIPAQSNENPKIKVWQVNDLNMGQNKIIDINGVLISPINSKPVITATLTYIPANFSSEFEKSVTFTTEVMDSLINLTTEHAAQVANGEITEIKVKLANKSAEIALSNLEIDLNFPAEFSLLESLQLNPGETAKPADLKALDKAKPDVSPKISTLTSLMPQEEKTIIYRGKFTVPESKNIDLNLQTKIKGLNDEYFVQEEETMTFEIIKGELLTNLIIQGSNQNKPVNPGDTLNYLLSIENKSKKTLGDIKIRAILDSLFIDWKSLNDKNSGIQEDNQILWTTEQIPALANLLPEEEVEIAFQIKLKNLADVKNYKTEDLKVTSFFETQVNKSNNTDTELTNESNTIVNEFNTNLTFASEARYFGSASETLGSGPLPPIVGQKTTYKIFWKLNNSLHEISNIIVKAKLPSYMTYEAGENLSTGNIIKNQNNEIVWQIARIPASVTQATADFSISLTPQTQDVGKILSILQEGTLTATDAQTNGQITITFPGQTTNLDSDPLGKGKGLIEAE